MSDNVPRSHFVDADKHDAALAELVALCQRVEVLEKQATELRLLLRAAVGIITGDQVPPRELVERIVAATSGGGGG